MATNLYAAVTKPGPQDIELWSNGKMIGHGFAALESLPDTPAYRAACLRAVRVEAQAVDAEARRDSAETAQRIAEAMVDTARVSMVNRLCEGVTDLGRRLDVLEHRAHVQERKRVRAELDALPDPEDPDSDPATHHPTGGLHSLGPAEEHHPGSGEFDPDA
jgi:hypothetical protein